MSTRFHIKSSPITLAQALRYCFELETAIGEIANGQRKPAKIPIEPICRVVQFIRDEAEQGVPNASDSPTERSTK